MPHDPKNLFRNALSSVKTNDTGHYMTKERIAAWIHIMAHDDHLPGLFVTHSRSVIEHLLDTAPEAKILGNINGQFLLVLYF